MKLVLTLGSDTPQGGAAGPIAKLAILGAAWLVVMNRNDIRRYVRLRRMSSASRPQVVREPARGQG